MTKKCWTPARCIRSFRKFRKMVGANFRNFRKVFFDFSEKSIGLIGFLGSEVSLKFFENFFRAFGEYRSSGHLKSFFAIFSRLALQVFTNVKICNFWPGLAKAGL